MFFPFSILLYLPNPPQNNKQLLNEVFVISRIIKVEVGVISQSQRLKLITVTETLIILDITKTESNNCFIKNSTKKNGPCLQLFFQCLAWSTRQT